MSFEIYLQCFEGGEPAGISRTEIAALFLVTGPEKYEDDWQVSFGQGECDMYLQPLDEDDDFIHQLTIDRPCQDIRLWEAVFHTMALGSVVLYFPGEIPPLVVRESAIADFPDDMLEAMGEPLIVNCPQEIVTYIETA